MQKSKNFMTVRSEKGHGVLALPIPWTSINKRARLWQNWLLGNLEGQINSFGFGFGLDQGSEVAMRRDRTPEKA